VSSFKLRNIGGASYGHDIRKFEKKLMHLQMLCGGLPTNKFGKGLANLDCFAWFSVSFETYFITYNTTSLIKP
jgi:hypothetical protein